MVTFCAPITTLELLLSGTTLPFCAELRTPFALAVKRTRVSLQGRSDRTRQVESIHPHLISHTRLHMAISQRGAHMYNIRVALGWVAALSLDVVVVIN